MKTKQIGVNEDTYIEGIWTPIDSPETHLALNAILRLLSERKMPEGATFKALELYREAIDRCQPGEFSALVNASADPIDALRQLMITHQDIYQQIKDLKEVA